MILWHRVYLAIKSDVCAVGASDAVCFANSDALRLCRKVMWRVPLTCRRHTSRPKGTSLAKQTSRSARAEHIVQKNAFCRQTKGVSCWRRGWDSNPCVLSHKQISSFWRHCSPLFRRVRFLCVSSRRKPRYTVSEDNNPSQRCEGLSIKAILLFFPHDTKADWFHNTFFWLFQGVSRTFFWHY